jgi:hypothetical protein
MASGARGLQHAVDVLYDSEMGLAEGGNCTGARELTAFFRQESETRGACARKLEPIAPPLATSGGESGRHFWQMIAVAEDDSDETILAIAMDGEEIATYRRLSNYKFRPMMCAPSSAF